MKVNKKKLEESDFFVRLLALAEDYGKTKQITIQDSVKKWIKEERYDYIKYFLQVSAPEQGVPFTITDLAFMSPCELAYQQKYAEKISSLLDEKRMLCAELLKAEIKTK